MRVFRWSALVCAFVVLSVGAGQAFAYPASYLWRGEATISSAGGTESYGCSLYAKGDAKGAPAPVAYSVVAQTWGGCDWRFPWVNRHESTKVRYADPQMWPLNTALDALPNNMNNGESGNNFNAKATLNPTTSADYRVVHNLEWGIANADGYFSSYPPECWTPDFYDHTLRCVVNRTISTPDRASG